MSEHAPVVNSDELLFLMARSGDVEGMAALLDENPARIDAREEPYQWSLLHAAAHTGQLPIVDLLLQRGFDVNTRENGDDTYAMHWAAAAGHADIVRILSDAGGDVVGLGDDHKLEVIGWATCWEGCDDDAHRAIAALLLERGAKHHIFSAIAMNLADEVRRNVVADSAELTRQMSRNEYHQLPLHFAARMNRPEMVKLLIDLGAEVSATADDGVTPLHIAAWHGSTESVRILLDAGADPNVRDDKHDSDPLGWAEYAGQTEAASLLRSRTE